MAKGTAPRRLNRLIGGHGEAVASTANAAHEDLKSRNSTKAVLSAQPPSPEQEEAMWAMRGLAAQAIRRGPFGYGQLDSFLQLSIVNGHDAAVDVMACIVSGSGAPAGALLRRLYESTNILTAGWAEPDRLHAAMLEALSRPHTDDRYATAAADGMLGAVMPSPNEIRHIAFGDREGIADVEALLKSLGHGGGAASVFYVTEQPSENYVERIRPYSLQMLDMAWNCITMSRAAASQIAQRLNLPMTYEGVDEFFAPDVIENAENDAIRAFDLSFPKR